MYQDPSLIDESFPYRSPSRVCEPIIQSAIINFHDKTIAIPECLIPLNVDQSFGILNLQIRDSIPIVKVLHVIFTIDRSGSMLDMCSDGLTKMAHIIFTLQNIIKMFHKKSEAKISIRVQSFDSSIYVDIDTIDEISKMNLEQLIRKAQTISPGGATNIEKALRSAKNHLDQYSKDNPQTYLAHIFLTDGDITDGSVDKEHLKKLVGKDYPNYFIGYGTQHNAQLLMSLSSSGKHNEYRFVDAIEKAGLVYGEIIHHLLYKAIEDVTLVAEHCEIYDYITNTWTTNLNIGNLISEQEKIYQIRSLNPTKTLIAVQGRTIHKTRMFEVMNDEIVLQTHASPFIFKYSCNLTQYLYRQKTQEMLFAVRAILELEYDISLVSNNFYDRYNRIYKQDPTNDELTKNKELIKSQKLQLKTEIIDFFKIMLNYVSENHLTNDLFMKTLCDDIHIAITSFDITQGIMYTAARQISQGRQQTYTCKTIDDTDYNVYDVLPSAPPMLQRSTSLPLPLLPQPNILPNQPDKYQLSQDDISAYSSQGLLKLMREVSNQPTL